MRGLRARASPPAAVSARAGDLCSAAGEDVRAPSEGWGASSPSAKQASAFHGALHFFEERGQFGFGLGGAVAVDGFEPECHHLLLEFFAQFGRLVRAVI